MELAPYTSTSTGATVTTDLAFFELLDHLRLIRLDATAAVFFHDEPPNFFLEGNILLVKLSYKSSGAYVFIAVDRLGPSSLHADAEIWGHLGLCDEDMLELAVLEGESVRTLLVE